MRLLHGGDRIDWSEVTAGELYGMARSWLASTQHSITEDPMFDPSSKHLGHDLSHHFWPEVTEIGIAAHAPGSVPGDHRDSVYQAMLPGILRLRERQQREAAARELAQSAPNPQPS